ncbi:MAG: class IV adenylate cyclase, partial [Anaerolineae bacterium]|nr:class IV adenylate cyclase [Anaerolineae bacterium]
NLLETEVKLHVPDLDTIRARLESVGATLESPRTYEHNIRYLDADGVFMRDGIVLRMRQDARARLTYKAPPDPGTTQTAGIRTRFEAEVTVDDFATMDVILQRLGFHPAAIYEKYRTTYRLERAAGAVEIVLDEMPFGPFVEIEGPVTEIEAAVIRLGLEDAVRFTVSYMVLFDRVKARLGLVFRDLTFANFADVTVPPDVFASGW